MATPDNEWWARRSHALKAGHFDIDGQFGPLRGVHNPLHRWNGFATPYFPIDSVLRVKEVVEQEQDYPQKFTIDDEGVWYWVEDYADEYDDPRGRLEASIEFDGVTMYDIGNGGWCWDEVTETGGYV